MKIAFLILTFVFLLNRPQAQTDVLRQQITHLIAAKKANIGVAIIGNEGKDSLSIHGNAHYPMQSVFKFHIVLAVLAEVDKGRWLLDQEMKLKPSDLLPNTWSPIREHFPKGGKLTLAAIIRYTVAQSDNNGCDFLLRLMGGTKAVNDYFKKNRFPDISIKATEEAMHKAWDVQFSNWTTPVAACYLLESFYRNREGLLSPQSHDFLLKTMQETSTGAQRIRGKLPNGAIVAHKTGSSGSNAQGVRAATNDIGIVTLPNGQQFYISVFVSNSTETDEVNEQIIADIARQVWDYYTGKA